MINVFYGTLILLVMLYHDIKRRIPVTDKTLDLTSGKIVRSIVADDILDIRILLFKHRCDRLVQGIKMAVSECHNTY